MEELGDHSLAEKEGGGDRTMEVDRKYNMWNEEGKNKIEEIE
jgi:hypothetical protein